MKKKACLDLPGIENEAGRILAEISPYARTKRGTGRTIATVQVPPSKETQEEWLSWAEGTLKKSQFLRDSLEDEVAQRKVMDPLNQASLVLVNFHGFLSLKKYERATATLHEFQTAMNRFRGELCSDGQTPAVEALPPNVASQEPGVKTPARGPAQRDK